MEVVVVCEGSTTMKDVSLVVESTAVDGDDDTKGFGPTSYLSRSRVHVFIQQTAKRKLPQCSEHIDSTESGMS